MAPSDSAAGIVGGIERPFRTVIPCNNTLFHAEGGRHTARAVMLFSLFFVAAALAKVRGSSLGPEYCESGHDTVWAACHLG